MLPFKNCTLGYCEAIAISTGQRCSKCAVIKSNNRWVCVEHFKYPPDEYVKPSGPIKEDIEKESLLQEIKKSLEQKIKETGIEKVLKTKIEKNEKQERKNKIKQRLSEYIKKIGKEEKEKQTVSERQMKDVYVNERVQTCTDQGLELPNSLAWLYNWLVCDLPDELKTWKSSAEKYWIYQELRRTGITYNDFISYYKTGKNKKVELAFEALFSQDKTGNADVKKMMQTAIQKEIEFKRRGLVTFYHAQDNIFWLYHTVVKIAAKREEKRIRNNNSLSKTEKRELLSKVRSKTIDGFRVGCFVDWNDPKVPRLAADRAEQMGFIDQDTNSIFDRPKVTDHEKPIGRRLVSVNYSIFGNHVLESTESTYDYILSNISITDVRGLWDDIPYITEDECDWLADTFYRKFKKEIGNNEPGLLSLISIPCGQVDNFVYNSIPHGNFNKYLPHKASELLKIYTGPVNWDSLWGINGGSLKFKELHLTQARITDMCYETYGRNLGIQITMIDTINPKLKQQYVDLLEKEFEKTM
jgi:hypothetical protein